MSEDPTHGATTIRASKDGGEPKGGGPMKWLLGAAAAVVLIGGGYVGWKAYQAGQGGAETAYNDPYAEEPLGAGPLEQDATAESASTDESNASPASTEPAEPARRSSARAAAVPEETIGITPINATSDGSDSALPQDGDDIVVSAPRRPVWARMPSERRLSALYPERALARGREGEARLHCTVQKWRCAGLVRRSEETPGASATRRCACRARSAMRRRWRTAATPPARR